MKNHALGRPLSTGSMAQQAVARPGRLNKKPKPKAKSGGAPRIYAGGTTTTLMLTSSSTTSAVHSRVSIP